MRACGKSVARRCLKNTHTYTPVCACECTNTDNKDTKGRCTGCRCSWPHSRPVSVVRPRADCPPDGMSERVVVEGVPSPPSLVNPRHHRGDSGHEPDPIVVLLLRPISMAGPREKDHANSLKYVDILFERHRHSQSHSAQAALQLQLFGIRAAVFLDSSDRRSGIAQAGRRPLARTPNAFVQRQGSCAEA